MDLLGLGLTGLISAFLSGLFTFLYVKKTQKDSVLTVQNMIKGGINAYNDVLEEQLKPIIDASSRAMGTIAMKSADVRQERSALRALGNDLIDQNEVMITAVEAISPLFGEKLRENPNLIIQLMPRINAILEKSGGIEGLINGSKQNIGENADNSRFWT